MALERKLINYLPYVIREYDVLPAIMEGEQPEFEAAWAYADDLLNNQFVHTAGNLGLSRWEKILEITPKGTDTIDDRRFRVLSVLNAQLPYTLTQLRVILESLCGPGNFSAEIAEGTYILKVRITVQAKNNYDDVEALLERVVPVNIVIDLAQLFNTHTDLPPFTHAQLATYTHYELRTENITAGNPTPHRVLTRFTHAELSGKLNKTIRKELNNG